MTYEILLAFTFVYETGAARSIIPYTMAAALGRVLPVESSHQALAEEVPVPPQYQQARVNDFRGAGFAAKGYREKAVKSKGSKRKLYEYQEQVRVVG